MGKLKRESLGPVMTNLWSWICSSPWLYRASYRVSAHCLVFRTRQFLFPFLPLLLVFLFAVHPVTKNQCVYTGATPSPTLVHVIALQPYNRCRGPVHSSTQEVFMLLLVFINNFWKKAEKEMVGFPLINEPVTNKKTCPSAIQTFFR